MKCKICSREAQNKYCELHEKAYRSILERYEDWKKALDIGWKEYLDELVKNPYTGVWAKEVASVLISETKE